MGAPTSRRKSGCRERPSRSGRTGFAGRRLSDGREPDRGQPGGSLALPNLPPLPPRPFAPARAVANAVKFASLKGDPVRTADRQRLFVELGMGVAEGRFVVGLSK
jgi:hypothetical protein